jgi:hypothetical protein
MNRVLRYRTDWERTPEGDVVTLPGYGGDHLVAAVAAVVLLFDEEGNTCAADVTEVEEATGLVHVQPRWAEWCDAPEPAPVTDLIEALRRSVMESPRRPVSTDEIDLRRSATRGIRSKQVA